MVLLLLVYEDLVYDPPCSNPLALLELALPYLQVATTLLAAKMVPVV